MGAGHGHDHGATASPRVRRALTMVLAPLAVLTLIALVVQWPGPVRVPEDGLGLPRHLARGTVRSVATVPCEVGTPGQGEDNSEFADDTPAECARASIRITAGPGEGESIIVDVTRSAASIDVEAGSKVVLAYEPDAPIEARYHVVDQQRGRPLALLALLFAIAVVALGRWRGLAALGGLILSFLVLTKFMLPALLGGGSPLPIAITASAVIMFVALYLSHGFSARTSTAVVGTLASLALTGLVAAIFVGAGRFTGLASEEAIFLGAAGGNIDLHGLLLAGVIIGSLGVLDDVTVTQASAIWELRAANPAYGFRELYRAGVRIGRDHIASTVNTLVLAYAGASLPLLLLFTLANRAFGDVVTSEIVAQEVLRTLVGSIGLVASVPITTALAALVASDPETAAAMARGGAGGDAGGPGRGGASRRGDAGRSGVTDRDPVAGRDDFAPKDEDDEWLDHLRQTWDETDDTAGTWRAGNTRRSRAGPDEETEADPRGL